MLHVGPAAEQRSCLRELIAITVVPPRGTGLGVVMASKN